MGLRETLEQLLASDDRGVGEPPGDDADRTVVYECRNCGTAAPSGATTCPTCGADEIATYAIE